MKAKAPRARRKVKVVEIPKPVEVEGWGTSLKSRLERIRKGTPDEVLDAKREARYLVAADGRVLRSDDTVAHAACEFLSGMLLHAVYSSKERDRTVAGLEALANTDLKGVYWMTFIYHDPKGECGWLDVNGRLTQTHPYVREIMDRVARRTPQELAVLMAAVRAAITGNQRPAAGTVVGETDVDGEQMRCCAVCGVAHDGSRGVGGHAFRGELPQASSEAPAA